MSPADPELRLARLIQRDGAHAADDAVFVLGVLDLVAVGAWSLRRAGPWRRWQLGRLGSPPAEDRALVVLDAGLRAAPHVGAAVPVQALGWWMRHWGIGATRVRAAALEELAALRFPPRTELPPRPPRRATDAEHALGGFPATRREQDFVRRLLRARDTPAGPVGPADNGDNRTAALRYGAGV